MKRKFAILFQGRTGSSYIVDALSRHPDILCYPEILASITTREGQLARARQIFAQNILIVGFKTKLLDILDPDAFARLIETEQAYVICMHRKNVVKAAISHLNAVRLHTHYGVWNRTQKEQRLPPLHIDPPDLEQAIQRRQALDNTLLAYFEKLDIPKLLLYYEDLIVDPETYMRTLLSFLSAKIMPLQGELFKNTDDDLSKSVANFAEIKSYYHDTPYEKMFDEISKPVSLYTNDYYAKLREGSRSSAREIVPLILAWTGARRVVDVGCGSGTWLSVFQESGIDAYLGIDGDYISQADLEIPPDKFIPFDLKEPLRLDQTFDLVLSLEVAEHLPAETAETFIDSLVHLGPVILFSAAIPLQGGANHLNEQWPAYWANLFQQRGYIVIDGLRPRLWTNQNVEPWYAQNALIFVRQDSLTRYPLLEQELARTDATQLARIHPRGHRQHQAQATTKVVALSPAPIRPTHKRPLEITEPIPDIIPPSKGIERLRCELELEGKRLGRIELPVCDGYVPAGVIADAIAAEHAWTILGRFFEHTLYPHLRIEQSPANISLWRGPIRLANMRLNHQEGFWSRLHNQIGWTIFLQELWGRLYWPVDYFYDSQLVEGPAPDRYEANASFMVEVSQDLPELLTPAQNLTLILTVGGIALGETILPVKHKLILPQEMRAAFTLFGGFELCHLAVREGLIGQPLTNPLSLRARLAARARHFDEIEPLTFPLPESEAGGGQESNSPYLLRLAQRTLASPSLERSAAGGSPLPEQAGAQPPLPKREAAGDQGGALILGRRLAQPIGTSASRRAVLPAAAAPDLIAMASRAGEPVIQIPAPTSSPPTGEVRVSYCPEFIDHTHLYSVKSTRTTRPASSSSSLQEGLGSVVTSQLPILLYHRITPTPVQEGQGGVSPLMAGSGGVPEGAFRQHLQDLRQAGYYSASLEEWRRAAQSRKPLPGRAILITFDGGYTDFQIYAWPLLKEYGFTALILLTAGEVGGVSRWHDECGPDLPLLDWAALRQLQKEGLEFGSQALSYTPLTALSVEAVVREAARSRLILEQGLDMPINTFAYPYGDADPASRHLVGACGYIFGLSRRPGLARFQDSFLNLPRLEPQGSTNLPQLIEKLGSEIKPT